MDRDDELWRKGDEKEFDTPMDDDELMQQIIRENQ